MKADLVAFLAPFAPLYDSADKAAYERGARHGSGRCLAVVRPSAEAEVQDLVRGCIQRGIPLVVQGANTSLVGAASPDATGDALVLSTERMRWVHDLSLDDMTVRAGAGTRLSALNAFLEPHGLWFPIDLGADPSIGGMVATNTGGSRLIRYGDVRSRVCGMRAVMMSPGGELLRLGRGLHKDNTGLDLKQLLIGSNGSLAVVTEATLRLARLPKQSAAALLALTRAEDANSVFRLLTSRCDGLVSAFEGISGAALELARAHTPGLQLPFPHPYPYYLLVEISAAQAEADLALDSLLMEVLEAELGQSFQDAATGKPAQFWAMRHALTEGARHAGRVIAFDISVRRDRLPTLLDSARSIAADALPTAIVADFGHWGDGGVHFNLVIPHGETVSSMKVEQMRERLFNLVADLGGSFSAEHGVGRGNADVYSAYTSPEERRLAGAVQRVFNPALQLGTVSFEGEGR